jgi:hypothetical protein
MKDIPVPNGICSSEENWRPSLLQSTLKIVISNKVLKPHKNLNFLYLIFYLKEFYCKNTRNEIQYYYTKRKKKTGFWNLSECCKKLKEALKKLYEKLTSGNGIIVINLVIYKAGIWKVKGYIHTGPVHCLQM